VTISLIYTDLFSGGELYQGGAAEIPGTPPNFTYRWQDPEVAGSIADKLQRTGVKLLVLAAKEYQLPIRNDFTEIVRFPLVNTLEFSPERLVEIETLVMPLAHKVAELVKTGNRVLVSCWEGNSRSSLITSLAIRFLTQCSAKDAIEFLQEKRYLDVFDSAALKSIADKPLRIPEK
jgi:hypothetical protein